MELLWYAVTFTSMERVEAFDEASNRVRIAASSTRSLSLVGKWGAGSLKRAEATPILQRFSSLRSLELHCLFQLPVRLFQLPQLARTLSSSPRQYLY